MEREVKECVWGQVECEVPRGFQVEASKGNYVFGAEERKLGGNLAAHGIPGPT